MLDIRLKKTQGSFTVDAAFCAKTGGITALFGPSGSGKTTVINMMAGLVRPDSGHIRMGRTFLYDSERGIDLPPENRRLGYVFQEGRLFPHLSVKANLVYGMKRVSLEKQYIGFDPVVSLLGLGALLERRPATLSGGEKQRVAIGRALLASPSLLLMDEPLAALDSDRKKEVLPFIADISREFSVPVLYVSHAREEIACLADDIVMMSKGRVTAMGGLEAVWGGGNPLPDNICLLPGFRWDMSRGETPRP